MLTLASCNQKNKKTDTDKRNFQIPVVVQVPTKDTIEFFKSDFLNDVWFEFYGKYKFTDSLHFGEHRERDTTYRKDYISEYSRLRKDDTLTTDGFQIFVDYKTTIYHREEYLTRGNYYFPVYVVNETSRTKVFIGKDSYVFGLQEAIDTSRWDEWRPIESKGFDFCGNGYFELKVHPGEFVMFLVPKYEGGEKQLMKVRLQVGESIYFSQSYEGTFNRKQFITKKDTWAYDRLKENKASAIQWIFYGATPKGYDDE
ncbi:MAG TPA: hypothetical protein DCF33_16015 [Saprospirales bacterium]|nr:hypothetical protein [Saprospirales bacterium]